MALSKSQTGVGGPPVNWMACEAAESAFNSVRDTDADPPIPYYVDDPTGWVAPFYFDSGKAYNANPDNLFDVPDDIGNIVFIPIC